MDEKKSCNCPFCNSVFSPANGMTSEEHIANGIISLCAELQNKSERDNHINSVCMRCGYSAMLPGVLRNSLSRHYDIYICPECGNDEAIRIFKKSVLPPAQWWCVREILSNIE
jgi:uncharacterized protein (DUF2225 family)